MCIFIFKFDPRSTCSSVFLPSAQKMYINGIFPYSSGLIKKARKKYAGVVIRKRMTDGEKGNNEMGEVGAKVINGLAMNAWIYDRTDRIIPKIA